MTWVRILFDDAEPMNIAAETASKKVTTGLPGGTYGLSKLIPATEETRANSSTSCIRRQFLRAVPCDVRGLL